MELWEDYSVSTNYSVKEQTEFASFMTKQLDKYGVPFAINADYHFYDYKAEQWVPQYKDLLNTIFMWHCMDSRRIPSDVTALLKYLSW